MDSALKATIFKHDPAVVAAVFTALEAALRKALQYDAATAAQLQALDDQVFAFDCSEPSFSVYFFPQTISFQQIYEGAVTATLSGSGTAFLALARANDAAAELINNPDLRLTGDSRALVKLQEILARVDIDWEAPLVNLFGDVIGHQLAETLRALHQQLRYSAQSLYRQLGEFLREESGWLPAREEVDDFLQGVDEVSMRVDRARATFDWLRNTARQRGKLA